MHLERQSLKSIIIIIIIIISTITISSQPLQFDWCINSFIFHRIIACVGL